MMLLPMPTFSTGKMHNASTSCEETKQPAKQSDNYFCHTLFDGQFSVHSTADQRTVSMMYGFDLPWLRFASSHVNVHDAHTSQLHR